MFLLQPSTRRCRPSGYIRNRTTSRPAQARHRQAGGTVPVREADVLEHLGPHRSVATDGVVVADRREQAGPERGARVVVGAAGRERTGAHHRDDVAIRRQLLVRAHGHVERLDRHEPAVLRVCRRGVGPARRARATCRRRGTAGASLSRCRHRPDTPTACRPSLVAARRRRPRWRCARRRPKPWHRWSRRRRPGSRTARGDRARAARRAGEAASWLRHARGRSPTPAPPSAPARDRGMLGRCRAVGRAGEVPGTREQPRADEGEEHRLSAATRRRRVRRAPPSRRSARGRAAEHVVVGRLDAIEDAASRGSVPRRRSVPTRGGSRSMPRSAEA